MCLLCRPVNVVGYVGALQEPVLHRGLKDQKSNKNIKQKRSTIEH